MDAYYGIERSRRFITLSAMLDETGLLREQIAMVAVRQALEMGGVGVPESAAASVAVGPAVANRTGETTPAVPPPVTSASSPPQRTLTDLLCDADNKEMLARAVLGHVASLAERGVLFVVRRCTVQLWDWIGFDLAPEAACSLDIDLTTEPLFTLLAGNDHFRGPIPQEPRFRQLFSRLGIDVPVELLLLPVRMNDRLVAILCCDGGATEPVTGPTEEFVELVRKLEMALHVVALKNRIRGG
jgi:hypothetical protein